MKKNKILVTGGAGYIGSHTIIELLNNSKFDVISVDNFCNSTSKSYNRIEAITGHKIQHYDIDLCDFNASRNVFTENPDILGIIHFAALKSVPESVDKPLLYYHNNNNSLQNILSCMEEFDVSNLIFSSSCSVYGNIKDLPVKEETPMQKAESPYGFTKQIGEQMITDFVKIKQNLNSVILRYFNPVGAHISGLIGEIPGDKPNNLVPAITQTAIGKIKELTVHGGDYDTRDGTCIRDYVHVSDIANAHICALNFLIEKRNEKKCNIFNLGTGEGITVLEAIQSFEKISTKKLSYNIGSKREGDVVSIYSDSSKAHDLLKWSPQYSLDQMMETAWKWELSSEKLKVKS